MTYLTIVAILHLTIGIKSLLTVVTFELRWIKLKLWRLKFKWNAHGFVDILISMTYGGTDYLAHIGVLGH